MAAPMPSTTATSHSRVQDSERVRKPCATVVPNGPFLARVGSTWIHCWSRVTSANWLITGCVTLSPVADAQVGPRAGSQAFDARDDARVGAPEQAGFGACRSDLVGHGHRHGHHFLGWVLLSLRMLSCHQPRVRGPWTDVRKPSER